MAKLENNQHNTLPVHNDLLKAKLCDRYDGIMTQYCIIINSKNTGTGELYLKLVRFAIILFMETSSSPSQIRNPILRSEWPLKSKIEDS